MKKIGITQKVLSSKNGFSFQIDKNWYDYFSKFNVNLIPLGFNKYNFSKIPNLNLDGIIISGGGNIFSLEKKKMNLDRDKFEKKLIKSYQKKNKPILLVCRGFQLLAKIYGARLVKIDNHVKKNHKIYLTKSDFFKKDKVITTNSFHNYGIKNLDVKFQILGKTIDGYIEFAKIRNKKIYCTMFHPERFNQDQKTIDTIIKKIFSI